MADQGLDQFSTSQNADVLARLLFELLHGVGGVALEQGGVVPRKRLGERSRGDELLDIVEDIGEWVVLLVGPEAVEILIGSSTEEQRPAPGHPFSHHPRHDLVVAGYRPAAVLEAAPRVLVGTTGSLHHAIERQVLRDGNPSHLVLLSSDWLDGLSTSRS